MIEVDYNPKNGRWIVTATVRDTPDLREIPGARGRKVSPGEAVWTVPGTIGAAKQIHRDLPQAEWTESALERRGALAVSRKRRMAVRRGDIVPNQQFMEEYYNAKVINYEVLREMRDRVLPLDQRDALLLQEVPGEQQSVGVRQSSRARFLPPMQETGVAHLLAGSGVLADDMGSGKGIMAAVALALLGPDRVLVLTTVSTLYMWQDNLEEWAGIRGFVFHGPKRAAVYQEYLAFEGPKALISTHALAQKHSARASFGNIAADGEPGEFNEPFTVGIVDEIHRMGLDPKAPGVRALHRIAQNCDVRWGLSGTPVNERPDDMWNLMRFVDRDVLQDRGAFRKRYCIMVDSGFKVLNDGLHPDMIEEYDFLVRPYFLRRLKREIVKDLPEALPPLYVRLPLTTQQQTLYNKIVKDGVARLPNGQVVAAPTDLDLHRLCEYVAQGIPTLTADGKVSTIDGPSNKLDYILDVLAERGPDRPVVVFAHSPKVTGMLARGLQAKSYRVAEITGSTRPEDRPALVRAFQNGSLDVMLITSAGSEGITLTAADMLIFVQEHERAITNAQTRDRIDRFGQTKETTTVVLISAGTVDESKRERQVHKINTQQLVLRDKKELVRLLNGTWRYDDTF